jgi:hypothetical protein
MAPQARWLPGVASPTFPTKRFQPSEEFLMYFIIREVIGWLLVVMALILIRTSLNFLFLAPPQVIEAAVAAFLCSLLMRSGIHLIRVSTAARLSLMTKQQ